MVDLDLPNEDEVEQDLLRLAREQERLLIDLQEFDENDELQNTFDTLRKEKFDEEMEALARSMSTLVPPGDIEVAIDELREVICYFVLF